MEGITTEMLQEALSKASDTEKKKLQRLLEELDLRKKRELCQSDFLEFVRSQVPRFHQRLSP